MKKRIISPKELELIKGCKVIGRYTNRSGEVCNIYETSDYSKFKRLPGNRSPELWDETTGFLTGAGNRHSNNILESMRVDGIMEPCFLIVTPQGFPTDAQHRAWALIRLGLPIQFIIETHPEPSKAMLIKNLNSSEWKTLTHIRSHAETGHQEFKNLIHLIDDLKLTVTACSVITGGSGNTKLMEDINFRSRIPWEQVFQEATYLSELVSAGFHKKFLSSYQYVAMMILIFRNAKRYNHEVMMTNASIMNTRILDNFTDSTRRRGVKFMVYEFKELFNRKRGANRLELRSGFFDNLEEGGEHLINS